MCIIGRSRLLYNIHLEPHILTPRQNLKLLSQYTWAVITEPWTAGLINNRPLLLTVWRPEVPDQGSSTFRFWWGPSSWFTDGVFSLCPRLEEGAGARGSLIRGQVPHDGGSILTTSSPPKAPPPDAVPLSARMSTYEFWRNANIHTTELVKHAKH